MTPAAGRKKRLRLWVGGCLVILSLSIAIPIAALWNIAAHVDDGTDALRAKGYPATAEELVASWYRTPPPGEDACEYYIQAGRLLDASTYADGETLAGYGNTNVFGATRLVSERPLGEPMPDALRDYFAGFLDYESEAFRLIDVGSNFETSDLPGSSAEQSDFLLAVSGQRLRTIYYSAVGNPEAALEELCTLVRMERAYYGEPRIDGIEPFRWRMGAVLAVAERILSENALSQEQLDRLRECLDVLAVDDFLLRACVTQRLLTLERMKRIDPAAGSLMNKLTRRSFIRLSDYYIAFAEDGLPARLDDFKQLGHRELGILDVYVHKYEPALINAVTKHYESMSRVIAARAAVAIARSLDPGDPPPDSIPASLLDSWPVDPFSGNPMIYKRLPDGFIVYGVGSNLIDDGGDYENNLDNQFRVVQ